MLSADEDTVDDEEELDEVDVDVDVDDELDVGGADLLLECLDMAELDLDIDVSLDRVDLLVEADLVEVVAVVGAVLTGGT